MDNPFHYLLVDRMNDLKYVLLTEVYNRLEADLLESFLEANEIDAELFQESVGQHIYPVTVDGLGRVQVFVPREMLKEAKILLDQFNAQE